MKGTDASGPAAEKRRWLSRFGRPRRWKVLTVIILTAHVLGFISSIHAVMGTRTAQGAIAWAVSLNTFPYVAVPAYWILGRSRFQGYITARQSDNARVKDAIEQIMENIAPYRVDLSGMENAPAGLAAERLAGFPYLRGNQVDLLVDGDATFGSILKGIDAAQHYVLFQFFIVHDDEIGREVQRRLIAKAREGVRIFFLYDEVGSHDLPDRYLNELREAGAKASPFHTRKGSGNRFQLNFRNHRKVVVVDGRVGWIGGHNVGDEYLGRDPRFGHWRDTHIRVEGPAVLGAQASFAQDWQWATGELLDLNWIPKPSAHGDLPVLILPSSPADDLETATLMFTHAINTARHRIWIASPYFVPDRGVISALQLAGLRGVDVRILIPEKPDHLLVYLAAFSYFEDAGRTGVRFYRYQDGFLHEKAMLIDYLAATIGTANFDNRSFRLNFEITGVVADSAFASEVERMFQNDFAKAREVGADELEGRSFWFKLGVRLATLTAPVQ
jgi:cardiolipin synthase A/B